MSVNSTNKKLCLIHLFNYTGSVCPFCEQERINHMCKKFEKKQEKTTEDNLEKTVTKSTKPKHKKKSKPREATTADLERLKEKFNKKY